MKGSIRYRMLSIFVGIMAFVLLGIWWANNQLLENYYTSQKLIVMEDMYQQLDGIVSQQEVDLQSLADPVQECADNSNIAMVLIDSNTGQALISSARDGEWLIQKLQRYVFGIARAESEQMKQYDNYTVELNYDATTQASYLEGWGYFSDNTTMFIMSMPLASIQDSVQVANRFLTYVGMGAMLIGGILTYWVTKRVTAPIMDLASISEKMSMLDFTASYEGDAEDEIGVLGRSMNTLSDKLQEAIGSLQKDIEEKTQIDEMRKDFIANVSHELKTPIALIQGYAEGLAEGMCEDEESRNDYCEVIIDEANKMNKMVKQLLELTALEFGQDGLVLDSFDLVDLISEYINSAHILLDEKAAEVVLQAPKALLVYADEFKIEEVFRNYLNNAMNHLDGINKIRITIEELGEVAKVSVYNTGQQIPEQDIPNLWTKFYKVDKARTRAYGGSGIGLSIVKAIIDSHHQDCGVENKEDGVEFWFTLKRDERNE